ncbi:hypothetical protein [Geotalea toluenoxydans]|uniref:hypothetical protein n=1 Tax=Geotalea toluenoxydans TaxID=421624 RepID=UPI0006D1CA82|nr:hypothetical protein [Geotalea toluenoxydans]
MILIHGLWDVLTCFNHLLEWICPEAHGREPAAKFKDGTRTQRFYYRLWNSTDYKNIKDLCNNLKHFHHKASGPDISIEKGAKAGLLRAGDSLSQTYFLSDHEDVRVILMAVYREYKGYFDGAFK